MNRLISLSCGLLVACWSFSADEPKTKEKQKPPYERLLKGVDAKKVEELEKKLDELDEADKCDEAIQVGEEILRLRGKIQGEDHWETRYQRLTLSMLKQFAKLSQKERTTWRQAQSEISKANEHEEKGEYVKAFEHRQAYLNRCVELWGKEHPFTAGRFNELATNLENQGKYREAQVWFEKALEIRRKVVGEEDPNTGISFSNLALNLQKQGKYPEAHSLGEKGLNILRKVLGEEDPSTISSYGNLAVNLQSQAKYREAQPLFERALELDRKVLGEEHPNTAFRYNNVAMNLGYLGKYPEAETLIQKSLTIFRKVRGEEHPNTATILSNLASNLKSQGKYREAEPLYQKALNIRRKILGENHPDTATSYNNLAGHLASQGKTGEAQTMFQKSLDICLRVLGEEHPDTADSYSNFASNLTSLGRYTEAEPLFQKALSLRLKILGEEHPDTAISYISVASNLATQGKTEAAQFLLEKSLNICRNIFGEEHRDTARCYDRLASNLHAQWKYHEAQILFQKALEIQKKVLGEEHPETAEIYDHLATNLKNLEKFNEAQALYEHVLRIRRKVFGEEHPKIADVYDHLASNLSAQKRYEEAFVFEEKALQIRQKVLGEDHTETIGSYLSVAYKLHYKSRFEESLTILKRLLEHHRKEFGEEHFVTAAMYKHLAVNLRSQQKYREGIVHAQSSVRSYEAARLGIASRGLDRATYGFEQSPYRLLAALQVKEGDFSSAFEAFEADLARGLLDEVASLASVALTPNEQKQQSELRLQLQGLQNRILFLVTRQDRNEEEQKELDRILDQRKKIGTQLATLAAKISQREISSLADIQRSLSPDSAMISWIDLSESGVEEHWVCLLRSEGKPIWESLAPSNKNRNWTDEDSQLPSRFREVLINPFRVNKLTEVKNQLYAQRLAPMEKYLRGIQHLYVVGVHDMASIPIEALTEKYTISYIPSGTFLARLKDRPQPKGTKVLALGDPIFPTQEKAKELLLPPRGLLITQVTPEGNAAKARIQPNDVLLKYADTELKSLDQLPKLIESKTQEKQIDVMLWRDGKTLTRKVAPGALGAIFDKQLAPEALAVKRKADHLLASLRNAWGELPGTAIEINRLKSLFGDKTQILMREEATEQNLESLRKSKKLQEFRYLHFATHGYANNAKAFESALILSPLNLSKETQLNEKFYNGELSAKEVLEDWKLDAELVTLSACESGLGRKGGGDGLLGFAQAFLKAGSRSVCLSLWKVDDCATALLMDRFYQNLLGKREGLTKPMAKAVALQEAKTWLRNLTFEESTKMSADISNGVARGKEKGIKLVIPKSEAKTENPKEIKPFEHPRYWAAFILIGDPS